MLRQFSALQQSGIPPAIRVALDSADREQLPLDDLRQYLGGVESLAREARITADQRVLLNALAVLSRQGRTIRQLLERQLRA